MMAQEPRNAVVSKGERGKEQVLPWSLQEEPALVTS